MSNLQTYLSRVASDKLSRHLGSQTTCLLEALGNNRMTGANLSRLLIAKIGESGVLFNKDIRKDLFKALPVGIAKKLIQAISGDEQAQPYEALENLKFSPSSSNAENLKKFFQVSEDSIENLETKEDIEIIAPIYPLFDHQISASLKVIRFIESPKPKVLLHMPTGAGKTRTAMNVITHILRKNNKENVVIWLANNQELCEQAALEFESAWSALGNRKIEMRRNFNNNTTDFRSFRDGFCVSGLDMITSQLKSDYDGIMSCLPRISMIVFDEAHHIIAPTYKDVVNILGRSGQVPVLGLSATPGRSVLDPSKDMELADFFFYQKVPLEVEGYANAVEYLQKEGYLAKINPVNLPYNPNRSMTLNPTETAAISAGFEVPESLIRKLSEDHQRNLAIINRIKLESADGSKIIVFACSVEHSNLLADFLRIEGLQAESITGGTDDVRRKNSISSYKKDNGVQILVNYGVLTTGFDAPKTNKAFITRPTNSLVLYSQMVGRAARGPRSGGSEECTIFTVVDELPGMTDMSRCFSFWDDIWNFNKQI